jgi:hypothetical protein
VAISRCSEARPGPTRRNWAGPQPWPSTAPPAPGRGSVTPPKPDGDKRSDQDARPTHKRIFVAHLARVNAQISIGHTARRTTAAPAVHRELRDSSHGDM